MKSLIILEVEHGDDTDGLTAEIDFITDRLSGNSENSVHLNDYGVRVDLPGCFVLDVDMPDTPAIYKTAAATPRGSRTDYVEVSR